MTPALSNSNAWTTTAIIPDLGASDLYVFRVNLPVTPAVEQQCRDMLTEQELERVARFKQELSRRHALIGRGILRQLLSRFLGIPPREIVFTPGPNGKPEADGISFNLAHSGNILLIAVSRTGLIGVDVEQVNPSTPILDIAERYFATTEIMQITSGTSEEERRTAFFRLWARKESIIKADGRGLSVELSSFAAEDLTTVPDLAGTARTFRVHSLPIAPGYAAAVATDQLSATPTLFLYPAL